jgi:RNA polymerase sigma factor (sigma-70 family)
VIADDLLLRRYVDSGSQQSFAELVTRHIDLVYSAAVRQVKDEHLAEDVVQAVFLVLARKAATLNSSAPIGGWLLTVARHASVDAMRQRLRSQHREQIAAKPEATAPAAEDWAELAPVLDQALTQLRPKDRDAIVLRFFEDRTFEQLGQALRITQEAARKRVTRALKKLRSLLARRGVSLSAAGLAGILPAHTVQAAPAGLAAVVTAATISGGTVSASLIACAIAKGAMQIMAWSKAKVAALALLGVTFLGTTVGVVISAIPTTAPVGNPSTAPAANASADLVVLGVTFDPLVAGKNVAYIKVRNPSAVKQVLAVDIRTQPNASLPLRGTNWQTQQFADVPPGATVSSRFAFKIFDPLTKVATIRIRISTLASADQYDFVRTPVQHEKTYAASELPWRPVGPKPTQQASAQQAQSILAEFEQLRSHLRDGRYADAEELFTADYRTTEFMTVLKLKELLERRMPGLWDKDELLALQPQGVFVDGNCLRLDARLQEQTWALTFAQEGGRWKIDAIAGFKWVDSGAWRNWPHRLLPTMQKRETEHLEIYYFPGSTAERQIEQIAQRREEGLAAICGFLQTQPKDRIRLVLFEDGQAKHKATGHMGDGWATGQMMVEVYNQHTQLNPFHETTHVVARSLGDPPALLVEGLAVYLSEDLGAQALEHLGGGQSKVEERCRQLLNQAEWIKLEELITCIEIGSKPSRPEVSYALAGGFVKFLIDRDGKDRFLKAYRTLTNSSDPSVQEENAQAMQRIYRRSVSDLEQEWKDLLRIQTPDKRP